MAIIIEYKNGKIEVSNQLDRVSSPELNSFESKAVELIINILQSHNINIEHLKIERRTENYLTLLTDDSENSIGKDFCRIKTTSRVLWIALELCEFVEELKNDPRLENVKNKTQRFWKITLSSIDDLNIYADLICLSFKNNANRKF